MSNRIVLFTVIALGTVVAGLVFAQSDSDSDDDYEWEMVSQKVAGTGGSGGGAYAVGLSGAPVYGTVFLYNKRTGKVFRYFENCGDTNPNGCVVPLRPVHDMVGIPLPRAQGRDGTAGR